MLVVVVYGVKPPSTRVEDEAEVDDEAGEEQEGEGVIFFFVFLASLTRMDVVMMHCVCGGKMSPLCCHTLFNSEPAFMMTRRFGARNAKRYKEARLDYSRHVLHLPHKTERAHSLCLFSSPI
jgi:hypothetical protein